MIHRHQTLALTALLAAIGLIYWPGLSGPWLFDDFSNIRGNAFLRVTVLDWHSLQSAASSLAAGPLGRPVAYLSFALDHYFHGNATPYAYKLTNVFIHALNTVLIAALLAAVLGRLAVRGGLPGRVAVAGALAVTALWALHPIQLTSVLYVVQRMTSLSATFTLAVLLCWLQARRDADRRPAERTDAGALPLPALPPSADGKAGLPRPLRDLATTGFEQAGTGRRFPATGWLLAGSVFWALGVFTKETAVLLPLYALALDRVMYPQTAYWQRWLRLPAGVRLAVVVGLLCVIFGLAAWHYAPGYGGRPFSLPERVLTQARVLWFYIGLMALPRINAFGLHHDDIAISTGLLTPWTTLPAMLGVAGIGLLAFRCMDRRPLVGLGLAWFLAGHVLESTVVPLEIAHEHRNYLPSLGLLLAAAGALLPAMERLGSRASMGMVVGIGAILAATTALRADQWGDELGLSRYEVRHHPRSAQARNNLAADLVWRGAYAEAREQLEAAMELAPSEVGYPMNLVGAYRVQRLEPPEALTKEILHRIRSAPLSAFGTTTLRRYSECLSEGCGYMAADVVQWLEAYLEPGTPTFDRSYVQFLLGLAYREQGRMLDALNAFQRAHDLDPRYLHPLFEQAKILLRRGQWDAAEFVLENIRAANENAYQRLDAQIAQLEAAIAKGRARQTDAAAE